MAQATLSCRFAAIHLEAALSECPVDTRNRRGSPADKQFRPFFLTVCEMANQII